MPSNLTSVSISPTSCGVSASSVVIRVPSFGLCLVLVPAQYSAGRAGLAHRQVLLLDLPRAANDAGTPRDLTRRVARPGRSIRQGRKTSRRHTPRTPRLVATRSPGSDGTSRNLGGATGSGPAQVDQTLPNTARHEPGASEPVLREPGQRPAHRPGNHCGNEPDQPRAGQASDRARKEWPTRLELEPSRMESHPAPMGRRCVVVLSCPTQTARSERLPDGAADESATSAPQDAATRQRAGRQRSPEDHAERRGHGADKQRHIGPFELEFVKPIAVCPIRPEHVHLVIGTRREDLNSAVSEQPSPGVPSVADRGRRTGRWRVQGASG